MIFVGTAFSSRRPPLIGAAGRCAAEKHSGSVLVASDCVNAGPLAGAASTARMTPRLTEMEAQLE
jgi:hypothetical protein